MRLTGARGRALGGAAVAVALAVLALSAGAVAARHRHSVVVVRSYSGSVHGGGTVSFKARLRSGRATRVFDFSWRNVPLVCVGPLGSSHLSSSGHFGWTELIRARGARRRTRRFRISSYGQGQGQGQGWVVKGRFSRGFDEVAGYVYVSDYEPYAQYPAASAHCYTSVDGNPAEEYVPWLARRH